VEVVEEPPVKKRRVWPVGKEGARIDALCVSAVTMPGAHLAKWGKGDKLYEKAASVFNEQPGRPFAVDGKATKDRFKLLKTKFEKKEADGVKASGSAEERSEMDTMMADACSAINDAKQRTDKAKGEASKAYEALLRAGEDARRSCLARRAQRLGQGSTEAENDDDETDDKKNDRVTATTASGRRRRREELEDEKDEELVALVKKNIEESRQVEQRRCAAEERRISLEEQSLEFARE